MDPAAQRTVSRPWVKARIAIFDVDQLGYPVVNRRQDGKYFIVDGQHRVELMRAVGWGDQRIQCECFEGLTQAEEAALFVARQDRKAVRRYDKFRIGITAGDPRCCAIDKIVRDHGLVVSDQSRDGHIVAVDALEKIYAGGGISPAKGPVALGRAMQVLVRAWGKQASSVNGRVLQGIGMVFLRYEDAINMQDLIRKLAPFPGGAAGMLGRGRTFQEMRGAPLHHCIASIIVDAYNRGRRVDKLDRWD